MSVRPRRGFASFDTASRPWKHPLRVRRAQVVAHARREVEKFFRRLDADRVPSFVVLARATMTIAVESGTNTASPYIGAAALEVAAQDVARHGDARTLARLLEELRGASRRRGRRLEGDRCCGDEDEELHG